MILAMVQRVLRVKMLSYLGFEAYDPKHVSIQYAYDAMEVLMRQNIYDGYDDGVSLIIAKTCFSLVYWLVLIEQCWL